MPPDYSGQNLRGRNFKGQNLEGANFSSADVTKANFTNANLREADFTNAILENAVIKGANFTSSKLKKANLSGAKAGLSLYWVIGLLVLLFLSAVLSGFTSNYVIDALYSLSRSESNLKEKVSGLATLFVLVFFFTFTIHKGLYPSLQISIFVSAVSSSFITAIISLFGHYRTGGVSFAGVISAAIVNAGIIDTTCIICILTKLNIWTSVVLAFIFGLASFSGALLPIIIRSLHIFYLYQKNTENIFYQKNTENIYVIITCLVIIFIMLLSIHIANNAMKGDERFTLIHKISIVFAATHGTCFRNADLTEANFTGAILQNTDLREANLEKTYFENAKGLDSVRCGNSYLQNPILRQVLVSRKGIEKKFDHQDLRGVNLKGANLVDASFIGANLSDVNLQDADLSRAKLVQTQLDRTDFTGATLTGAYIEDWGITNSTLFDRVWCEYVYMRLPTIKDPDPLRKPDNREEVFADGEFGDFIKPIVDTLDLYHNSGVDPRAIAISFKQLAENHPEAELRIVGMEVKGEDKFLLSAKTADSADKSELSAEYFSIYNELKTLAQQEVKALISEKDYQIHRLENMVMTALERPGFYAQTYNNQGDTMPGKQSNFNLQGAQFGGGLVDAETVTAHQIGGNITNHAQVSQTETNSSTVKTILILASNPKTTTPLRLDEEVREIDAGLQRAKKRELFDFKQRWAVRVQDVYQSLLDFNPSIVHFSGHGSGDDGLVLEDEAGQVQLVETVALAGLFELFASTIECVVLNACYSEVQARVIAQHIPYVIGMSKEIGDRAAIKFATGFYSALSSGESVEFAYKLGCSVIQLDGIAEHLTPVLKKK